MLKISETAYHCTPLGVFEEATYGDQVISFHDQARGQEHRPEDSHLIFLQRLLDGEQTVGSIAFLGTADQVICLGDAKIETFELLLGRDNDRGGRHSCFLLRSLEVEAWEEVCNARAGVETNLT